MAIIGSEAAWVVSGGQHFMSPIAPTHLEDIAAMKDAGFGVGVDGDSITAHVRAFQVLGRCDFQTVSPGTRPQEVNCKAFPRRDGGWDIHRFGTSAETAPGWSLNSHGCDWFRYPGQKPTINISITDEKLIADRTTEAIGSLDTIYQRGGLLSFIKHDSPAPTSVKRDPGTPTICPMPTSAIREAIATAVNFEREGKDKVVRCGQPGWLAKNIEERGRYPRVPTIEMVSSVPLFLASGDILTEQGFHEPSGIYFEPSCQYAGLMPVTAAITLLDDVIDDFPFLSPSHRSTFYAALLTLLARPAFSGPAPLFLFEGNRPSVGKGLIADCLGLIGLGRGFARMTAPENGGEDEWRKRLTAIALAGDPAMLLDNLEGKLKSSTLDAILTSTVWEDRRLGSSSMVRVPWQTITFATANNLTMSADTIRRTCYCRLESPLEKPQLRSDCKYPDLLGHVRANRGKLTAAGLSILHHFDRAGRPDQGLSAWGSFEGWSTLIRNAVAWAGVPDPGETRETLALSNDDEATLLRMLLDGWQEADPLGKGMTSQEAIDRSNVVVEMDGDGVIYKYPTLKAAIDEIGGRDRKLAVGQALRKYKGRKLNERTFVAAEGRVKRWKVAA